MDVMRWARTTWMLGTLAGVPGALAAQERSLLPLGVRLRVTSVAAETTTRGPHPSRVIGTLAGLRADALILAVDRDVPRVVPLSTLRDLEVSRGRHAHAGRGALLGLAAGAAAGATTMVLLCAGGKCESSGGQFTAFLVLGGGGAGALAGAGIGALVGSLVRTEQWERVSLDGLRVSADAHPSRLDFAVSIPLR